MDNTFFRDKIFSNEEFVIEGEFWICIGVNTVLDNCTIINKQPAGGI